MISISDSFSKILSRIQPAEIELNRAGGHASTIKSRLEKYFDLRKFELIGSHSRNSAVKGWSDVDFFALFSRDDMRWGGNYVNSRTILIKVAQALQGRYPQTKIGRDGQAVVVGFGDGNFAVDVVPAFFEEFDSELKSPIYCIPDGKGGWIITAPALHNKYITEADDNSNSKLVRTVQLIKTWQYSRTPKYPLNTFHLEMLLAYEGVCSGVKSYAECMTEVFDLLYKRQCRPLRDPLRISGYINTTNTELQRENLYKAVSLSRERAVKALELETDGKIIAARRFWNIIFNGRFPS